MSGDIREAHFRFAKELLKMYDDVNEFENLKKKYLKIANGGIPNNIEEIKIKDEEINICDLLIKVGFASSKGEAKRMVMGNGVKINTKIITNIAEVISLEEDKVVQFGKNRFANVKKEYT